jgi:hypothetical protein
MSKRLLSLILAVGALCVLTGCSGADGDQGVTITEPPKMEDEIKRIQDDPNMPQQAKDMQIAQIKARAGGAGSGMGKEAGTAPAPDAK